jgi:hypothetical protein
VWVVYTWNAALVDSVLGDWCVLVFRAIEDVSVVIDVNSVIQRMVVFLGVVGLCPYTALVGLLVSV